MILEYTFCEKDEGKYIKDIISRQFALSARAMTRLKKSQGIAVDGKVVTVRHIAKCGEKLTLTIEDTSSETIEKSHIPLDILYEDESVLVVNKPYGMPTHPSFGHRNDTLANAVMYRYSQENFTFRAITRLDGDTTGVVLIARNALSAQRLTEAMQNGKIKKEYCAIVLGVPKNKHGVINAPIARSNESIIKRTVSTNGKEAITEYEVESVLCEGKYSLINVYPKTGRTHQIRLHLSHIGHPIYADFLYGVPIEGERAYLHCKRLTFLHPITGKEVKIIAPLPDDMLVFCKKK